MINEDELARKPKHIMSCDNVLGADRIILKTPAGVNGVFVSLASDENGSYILQVQNNMSAHWFELHMTRDQFFGIMGIDPNLIG